MLQFNDAQLTITSESLVVLSIHVAIKYASNFRIAIHLKVILIKVFDFVSSFYCSNVRLNNWVNRNCQNSVWALSVSTYVQIIDCLYLNWLMSFEELIFHFPSAFLAVSYKTIRNRNSRLTLGLSLSEPPSSNLSQQLQNLHGTPGNPQHSAPHSHLFRVLAVLDHALCLSWGFTVIL